MSGVTKLGGLFYLNGQARLDGDHRKSARRLDTFVSRDFETWSACAADGLDHSDSPAPTDYEEVHLGAGLWNRGNVILGIYGQWHNDPSGDRRWTTIDLGLAVSHDALHFKEPIPYFKLIPAREQPGGPSTVKPALMQGQGMENFGDQTLYWYSLWRGNTGSGVRLVTWPRDRIGALQPFAPTDVQAISCPIQVLRGKAQMLVNATGLGQHCQLRVGLLDDAFQPVSLPDTQHYSAFYQDVYYRQTQWIVQHAETHNIKFVLHEGDITDNNGTQQWTVAKAAMSQLSAGGVPYVLVTGNHDMDQPPSPPGTPTAGRSVPRDRNTGHINRYFSADDYRNSPKWGAYVPGHVENSWHEIDTPNGRLLIIGLEFGVSDGALAWAKKISEERPHDILVFLTHGYLNADGTRYNYDSGSELQRRQSTKFYPLPDSNDGENIWQKWLINQKTGKLVICGHAAGRGGAYLRSENNVGTVCHQIFANYQIAVRPDKGFGGGGSCG